MQVVTNAVKADAAPPTAAGIVRAAIPKTCRMSVAKCRAVLRRPTLTDAEANEIIDHLYSFAEVITDVFIEQQPCSSPIREPLEMPMQKLPAPALVVK